MKAFLTFCSLFFSLSVLGEAVNLLQPPMGGPIPRPAQLPGQVPGQVRPQPMPGQPIPIVAQPRGQAQVRITRVTQVNTFVNGGMHQGMQPPPPMPPMVQPPMVPPPMPCPPPVVQQRVMVQVRVKSSCFRGCGGFAMKRCGFARMGRRCF